VKKAPRTWDSTPVARTTAAVAAIVIAFLLGWRTYVHELAVGNGGGDFVVYRNAAVRLLQGRNPYDFDTLLYPLPVAISVVPISWFNPILGAGFFTGLSALALVYGLLRRFGWPGLVMLLSPTFFLGWYYLQWSPLIVASALLPWLGAFGAAKPNVAFGPFAYRPSWQAIVGGLGMLVISWFLVPSWLGDWLGDVGRQTAPHTSPVRWPVGLFGLLGLLRWRRSEGRVLLVTMLSPLNPQYYDHLAVWLAAASWRDSIALSVCGWIGFLTFVATAPHDLTRDATPAHLSLSLGVYLPAALLLLRHPNVGNLPPFLERFAGHLPRWIRGAPPEAAEHGAE
jgi:MYXO-CTERM domain-containing protein